jgi:toxin ParE1/3/4
MSRIKRTRRAQVDAKQIWVYIAERNYPAADALISRINTTCKMLADNAHLGEAVDHLRPGARRFSVGSYVLYFEPIENGIRVLRVVHSSRQMDDLFD